MKFFVIFAILIFSGAFKAFTQENAFGLTTNELTSVIQKTIDLPGLQKYYPTNADGTLKQLNILKYPIALPAGLSLSKNGTPVNLIPQSTIGNIDVDAYARFRSIDNTGTLLKVNLNYFYKDNQQVEKTLFVLIEFQKSGSEWSIVNSSIKGDTL